MRLIFVALLFIASPAGAATYQMKACAGGADPHRDVDCGPGDCCPAVLSSASAVADSTTTATVQVNTTVESGNMYLCFTTGASPPNTFNPSHDDFDPTSPTGCASHTSTPVSGTPVEFTDAGSLTAETTYRAHLQQRYANRWAATTATSAAFATPAESGGGDASITQGHWVVVTSCRSVNDCAGLTSTILNSDAVGVILQVVWRDLEGSSDNAWTFSWLQTAVNSATAAGKKVGFQLVSRRFLNASSCTTGSPTVDCRSWSPQFMWSDATYGYDSANYPNVKGGSFILNTNGNIATSFHIAAVRTQLAELMVQFDTIFGGNADVEVMMFSESTASDGLPSNGYSSANWVSALQDRASKARTNLGVDWAIYQLTNFIPDEVQFNNDPWLFAKDLGDNYEVYFSNPDDFTCTNQGLIDLWADVKANWGGTDKVFTQTQQKTIDDSLGCIDNDADPAPEVYETVVDCLNPTAKGWVVSGSSGSSVLDVINDAVTYPIPGTSGTCPLPL